MLHFVLIYNFQSIFPGWFISSKISFIVIHLKNNEMNLHFELTRAHNELTNLQRSKQREVNKIDERRIEKSSIPRFDTREGIPATVVLSSVENSSSFFLFLSLSLQRNVQWSSTIRPLMSRFSSFRVRTPNERFFPLLRHDTRLCRRKTIMYRHNKLFLPSSSCKPSFPPRLDLFSAFHFLCIANRKRKRKRGEIFDEEKEKVDERGVDEGSKEIVRRKLNVGITRRFCYLWSSISSRLPALKFRENKETTPSIFGSMASWKYELGIRNMDGDRFEK